MSLLEGIRSPADVKALPEEQLAALAAEVREFLVSHVTRTGGHLGPNLGVVELTIALHRVFDSPTDVLVWDTGHQTYVHKMLTGRMAQFDTLRQAGGLSGYASRAESLHDVVENSHASTALSYADGIAKAFEQRGQGHRRSVVAVIGDGALTGGMAWEALNNIAAAPDRPVVMVFNDNERSYSPTIGGLAQHLATLRTTKGYERFLEWGRTVLGRTPVIGAPVYDTLHGLKKGLKDIVAPQGMFEDLGLKYIGPVDGHDIGAVEHALRRARAFRGPVIVHVLTEKGRGYRPAELDDAERFHAVGVLDPETGQPLATSGPTWTSVFADELVAIGRVRPDVVAVTAAMAGPTGLDRFGRVFPGRLYDVGIAEAHAATSAAGMAYGGLHPVVAVYATFLNRAFDQVLLDCALHRAGVTFALDRAGVTGDDGPSHNGMWDLSILQVVPGLALAAPRDGTRLRELLREAVAVTDGPTVVRYPKGAVPADIPALERLDGVDVLRRDTDVVDRAPGGAVPNGQGSNGHSSNGHSSNGQGSNGQDAVGEASRPARGNGTDVDVLVVSYGAMAGLALDVADRLHAQGIGVTVVDPRWVAPVAPRLVGLAARSRLVVTLEDNGRVGGAGSRLAQVLRDEGVATPVRDFGLPQRFLDHGKPAQVRAAVGLTAQEVSRSVVETIAGLDTEPVTSAPAGTDH